MTQPEYALRFHRLQTQNATRAFIQAWTP